MKLIALVDCRGGISKNGKQPLYIPEDLKYFSEVTRYHPVIMGRKTMEDIRNFPLPLRWNIVLSRHKLPTNLGFTQLSMEEILTLPNGVKQDAFVIGGESIYSQLQPFCNEMYLTVIHHDFDCDKHIPPINHAKWIARKVSGLLTYVDEDGHEYHYTHRIYRRG